MLRSTGLLSAPHEDAFDRLAGLARKVLKAPVGMVSLLDDRHLHVKSCVGLPELAKAGRVPATDSFCQHVVITEAALVVDDAREHELTRDLAIVKSGMALAYAGVPLVLSGGFVIGALSVTDSKPRAWKPGEIELLHDLAASVLTEIEMRADIEARKQAETELRRSKDRLRGLMDNIPTLIYAKDLEGRYLFLNHAGERAARDPGGGGDRQARRRAAPARAREGAVRARRGRDRGRRAGGDRGDARGRRPQHRLPLGQVPAHRRGRRALRRLRHLDRHHRAQADRARAARGAAALRQRVRPRPHGHGDGRHRRPLPPGQRRAVRADRPHRGASCSR